MEVRATTSWDPESVRLPRRNPRRGRRLRAVRSTAACTGSRSPIVFVSFISFSFTDHGAVAPATRCLERRSTTAALAQSGWSRAYRGVAHLLRQASKAAQTVCAASTPAMFLYLGLS